MAERDNRPKNDQGQKSGRTGGKKAAEKKRQKSGRKKAAEKI